MAAIIVPGRDSRLRANPSCVKDYRTNRPMSKGKPLNLPGVGTLPKVLPEYLDFLITGHLQRGLSGELLRGSLVRTLSPEL